MRYARRAIAYQEYALENIPNGRHEQCDKNNCNYKSAGNPV
jgi:hypothetical protein